MSLDATTLAGLIHTQLQTQFSPASSQTSVDGDLQKMATAIATAVVQHIQNAAVVNITLAAGCTANGVTAGAAAVPVTGSGTGTIS